MISDIKKQLEQYLPEIQNAEISIEIDNTTHVMTIIVDTRDAIYGLQYNQTTDQVTTQYNEVISFTDLY